MAKTPKAPKFADRADTDPNYRHEAFADWLTTHTGYEVDLKTVQLAASLTNEFRGSEEDIEAKERYAAEREEAKRQAKLDALSATDAKIEKQRQRLAELEAQKEAARAAILAGKKVVRGRVVEDDETEAETSAPRRRRAAKKAAPAVEAEATEEATVTPIKRTRRPSRAARASAVVEQAVEDDDEF